LATIKRANQRPRQLRRHERRVSSEWSWKFTVNRIVGNDTEAVSDVSVTDDVQQARLISFFTMRDRKISKMVEFWPEPFPAQDNRRHLVEKFDSSSSRVAE